MKKKINYNLPATLFDVTVDSKQGNFSRGKLKVFYIGETADKRYFSEEFGKELIKTLPYTPIVSRIDEDKDDFVGHASQQEILGIVDPCSEPYFEVLEDGLNWAICDVVLYTERPDRVGEWAKKIVGHPQSLELDPKTVKYNINYDEKRHFKNLEFTAGSFVGVSVLGNDQQPAFTGSEFFGIDKFKMLKDYCEHAKSDQNGGMNMNFNEFLKLSWGDLSVKISEALSEAYDNEYYWYIVDFFDDSVVVRMYSYYDGKQTLNQISYTADENGVITLGNVTEVAVQYVPVVQTSSSSAEVTNASQTNASQMSTTVEEGEQPSTDVNEINPVENTNTEETPENSTTDDQTNFENNDNASQEPNTVAEQGVENQPASEENVEQSTEQSAENFDNHGSDENPSDANITPVNTEEASADNNEQQEGQEQEASSTTTLTESERTEFEALKRERKITILNNYKDYLTEEQFTTFSQNIDNYSDNDLELELLRIYKSSAHDTKEERAFALADILNNAKTNSDSSLDAFVRRQLRKN